MELNYGILFFILLITFIIITCTVLVIKNQISKLIYVSFVLGYFIYSGVGISDRNVSNFFILHYSIYLIVFSLIYALINYLIKEKNYTVKVLWNKNKNLNDLILNVLVFIFFICEFLFFVFPKFRLEYLIIPPKSNVYTARYIQASFDEVPILSIAAILLAILLPFLLIKLKILIDNNNRKTAMLLLVYWFYLEFAKVEYISRSQFMVNVVLIYLVYKYDNNKLYLNRKVIQFAFIIFLVGTPILYIYSKTRLNIPVSFSDVVDSYTQLYISEINYPQYYDDIINSEITYGAKNYFKWILTLPIPNFIWTKDIIPFNLFFTKMINSKLDYILLPSILGESFLIFSNYYFIHAAVTAFIISVTDKILSKYNFLFLVRVYIVLLAFNVGRGGSIQIISFCINGLIIVWIYMILKKIFVKKDRLE